MLLGHLPGTEQVELDSAGNSGDAGLTGLAGGEVAGLVGLPRAGRSMTSSISSGENALVETPTEIRSGSQPSGESPSEGSKATPFGTGGAVAAA